MFGLIYLFRFFTHMKKLNIDEVWIERWEVRHNLFSKMCNEDF